jgi:hypothetical protein
MASLVAFLFTASLAVAGEIVNKDRKDVAIRGYDTVAYFTENKPVPGLPEFVHEWHDAKWQFASAEHRDLFASDPERYAPRYGGFCAGGMALGQKATVDPEAWTIIDDKLYMNFAKSDVPAFLANADEEIAKADRNWQRLGTAN